MAMHGAVLLAEENRQLRTENQRQKKKKQRKRTFIATGGVLTVQEGLDRVTTIEYRASGGCSRSEYRA